MCKSTYLYILCTFFFFYVLVNGEPEQLYFKMDFPDNVPADEEFEVSTLFKTPSDCNDLVFYITTDFNSLLKYVAIKSDSIEESLSYSRADSVNLPDNVFRVAVKNHDLFNTGICQLLLKFNSRSSESSEIGLYYSYNDEKYIEEIGTKEIAFYTPQTTAGKGVRLTGDSFLTFYDIFEESQNNIGIEFWLKTDIHNEEFFRIFNSNSSQDESLVNLVVSNFGYITSSNLLNATVETEFFSGGYNWNHIFIVYDKSENSFKLICNDSLSIDFKIENFISPEDLGIEFFTDGTDNEIYIDNLRLWEYSGEYEEILEQKHFNSISVEDAELLSSYQFSSKSQLNSDEISSQNIQLVKSDAPIFSKAPTISVSIFDNVNQISISLNDISDIELLTLEKSYDGSSFDEVQEISALTPGKTKYTISDYDDTDNEIIYYRVEQVTADDDVVYSNSVKVGRGKQIHFEVNQNYPNPFNPSTVISINVNKGAEFQIRVYDVVGKLVAKLFDGYLNEGIHQFEFVAKNLPSGIYFAEVKSEDKLNVMKMILAK